MMDLEEEKIQTSFLGDKHFSSGKEEARGVRIEQELTVSAHRAFSIQRPLGPMRFNAIIQPVCVQLLASLIKILDAL
jgi:hypothetical protein